MAFQVLPDPKNTPVYNPDIHCVLGGSSNPLDFGTKISGGIVKIWFL